MIVPTVDIATLLTEAPIGWAPPFAAGLQEQSSPLQKSVEQIQAVPSSIPGIRDVRANYLGTAVRLKGATSAQRNSVRTKETWLNFMITIFDTYVIINISNISCLIFGTPVTSLEDCRTVLAASSLTT